MFDSLRKKLSSFFGKEETKAKKSTKKSVKSKSKKQQKQTPKAKKSKKVFVQAEQELPPELEKEEAEIEEENIELEQEELNREQKEESEEKGDVEEKSQEKTGFFSKFFKKLSTSKLTQEQFDEFFSELEITLLENNVALEVVDKIKENLSKSLIGTDVKKSDIEKKVLDSLKESILSVLIEPPNLIDKIKSKEGPFVILFFGINGTGKTTSIAKMAHLLKKQKISCVLAAADTFRAASIEQLKTHADNIGVPMVSSTYGSDPASVAFDAIQYAKKNSIQAVLIDTAGRMYTKSNLMKEMEKIIRVSQPDLKIFVGESITGNDVLAQSQTFNETAGIDGIILTKSDVDEKGGAILSIGYITGKPIYYLGVGQAYDDLDVFQPKKVLAKLGLD